MFRATFTFASHGAVCGLQIDAVAYHGAQRSAVQLTYRVRATKAADFQVVHVGEIHGYSAWSEPPLALLLRSLFTLRAEWFSAIPSQLIAKPILDMNLSVIHLSRNGQTGEELASLSLQKKGYDTGYLLAQSLPNRALIPMRLDEWSSVPFGAATQAVAAVQLEAVDLQTLPDEVKLEVFIGRDGEGRILRDQIPYYAVDLFDALRTKRPSCAGIEPLVPVQAWRDFLAA